MNENMSWLLADLDDLHFRMECGRGLLDAVHECMTGRTDGGKDYHDALFGAILFVDSLTKELRTIVDEQYKKEGVEV